MRIGIVGAGAMGGFFGARLLQAGQDVSFIDVSETTLQAIRSQGLRLVTPTENIRLWPIIDQASAYTDPFDLLLIFTKGFHTAAAIAGVRHLLSPLTWVMSVQNGLGNIEAIAGVVQPDRIIVGVTNFPADLRAPGLVHSVGHGHVRIWCHQGQASSAVAEIATMFDNAGLSCIADPHVQEAIWEKLAFNVALNSICAVTGLPVGALTADNRAVALVGGVVDEVTAVAQAHGLHLNKARINAAIAQACASHGDHKPSMLQDLESGSRTENDLIAGAVVAYAARSATAAPVTNCLYSLVRLVERRATAPD